MNRVCDAEEAASRLGRRREAAYVTTAALAASRLGGVRFCDDSLSCLDWRQLLDLGSECRVRGRSQGDARRVLEDSLLHIVL
jgi:hypothetical protein